jgi:hypothetical protein
MLIHDIKELLSHNNIFLCHIFRERNQCADFFAKLRASSDADLSIHASPSEGILDLLRSGAAENFFRRKQSLSLFLFLFKLSFINKKNY